MRSWDRTEKMSPIAGLLLGWVNFGYSSDCGRREEGRMNFKNDCRKFWFQTLSRDFWLQLLAEVGYMRDNPIFKSKSIPTSGFSIPISIWMNEDIRDREGKPPLH